MWGQSKRPEAAAISLEAYAEHAGEALACVYASSSEFDAALIARRRAEGVYGPKRQRRQILATAGGIVLALAVIVLAILSVR